MKHNVSIKKISTGILVSSIAVIGITLTAIQVPPKLKSSLAQQTLICPSPEPGKQSLQLKPCYPPSPTPQPTSIVKYSAPDGKKQAGFDCTEITALVCDSCRSANLDPHVPLPKGCAYTPSDPSFQTRLNDPNCNLECIGKPVIYLYPTKITNVDVTLTIPGIVTQSDPLYPVNGWKNVEAHPDGSLVYQGGNYHELFYESEVAKVNQPATGLVIPTENLHQNLISLTTQLGLISSEQQEFLDYWMPKLQNLHTPYILFSLLDSTEKERVDHVDISPKPDTTIAFLVYFKGLQTPDTNMKPLQLPSTPQRIGFTSVEWGGLIGKEDTFSTLY